MAEIDAGLGIPHEQVKREVAEWLSSSGRRPHAADLRDTYDRIARDSILTAEKWVLKILKAVDRSGELARDWLTRRRAWL